MIICLYCREGFCCPEAYKKHEASEHKPGDALADPCGFCGQPIYREQHAVQFAENSVIITENGVKNIEQGMPEVEDGRIMTPAPGANIHAQCFPYWMAGVVADIEIQAKSRKKAQEPWDGEGH